MRCPDCGAALRIGDYPFCHGDPAAHQPYGGYAAADDIPGGLVIEHGLVGPDGGPLTVYSRSELRREAARQGWTPFVRHQGTESGDKSPHTQRFV